MLNNREAGASPDEVGVASERARMAFSLYAQMGPGRSLSRLHQLLGSAGVRVSLVTLKRYSAKYRWQAEIAALNSVAREGERSAVVAELKAMNDRHGQLARALQGAGGSALQRLLASDARLTNLKPSDIARLIELGLKAERQALAEAADHHQIAVNVWNAVVGEVVQLFTAVNPEPDPDIRTRRFARSVDRLIDERLGELKTGSGNGH